MTGRVWIAACLCALAAGCTNGGVVFDDAWVRGARPGSAVAAGYCAITNTGAAPVTIVAFVGAGRVEMHETRTVEGMSRMRPLESLAVAAGETVKLEPGGKHLMLFDLDPAVRRTTLHAVFDDGTRSPVDFEVRPWRQP